MGATLLLALLPSKSHSDDMSTEAFERTLSYVVCTVALAISACFFWLGLFG